MQGKPERRVTLVDFLRNNNQLEKIGGAVYLIYSINAAPLSVKAILYPGIIWRKVVLQFLIRRGNEIINRCSTCGDEVKKVIVFAEWDIPEISSR